MMSKRFEDVMDLLKTVPGVKDHLESFEVQMGKQILKRRIELGWSQQELVNRCRARGITITQPMLSKIETGNRNIESQTYNKVFDVLGGIQAIEVRFGDVVHHEKKMTLAVAK